MKDRFTEEEVQAILAHAVEQQAVGGTMTRAQLEQIASEIGVGKEALARAEQETLLRRGTEEDRAAFDEYLRSDVLAHAIQYAAISAFLFALDLFMTHRITWSIFPMLGMALAFALQARWLIVRGGSEYDEKYLEWLQRRQKRLGPL